jgi:hypothetical protein
LSSESLPTGRRKAALSFIFGGSMREAARDERDYEVMIGAGVIIGCG